MFGGLPLGQHIAVPFQQVSRESPGVMAAKAFSLGFNYPLPQQSHPVLDVPRDPLRDGVVAGGGLLAAATGLVGVKDDVLRRTRGLEYRCHRQPSFLLRRGLIAISSPSASRILSIDSKESSRFPLTNREIIASLKAVRRASSACETSLSQIAS